MSPYLPPPNPAGKPQLAFPVPSSSPDQDPHPCHPGQVAQGTALGGPLSLTPLWSLAEGRSAAGAVPGVCQACPHIQGTSPGHGSCVLLSWGAHQALVKILQGFPWSWEGSGLGQRSHAGVFHVFMAWHMLCSKWALCTCLGCCSLKSIAMATAPSHAVHSCCRRDKEHILKQHILNVDVLKCNF